MKNVPELVAALVLTDEGSKFINGPTLTALKDAAVAAGQVDDLHLYLGFEANLWAGVDADANDISNDNYITGDADHPAEYYRGCAIHLLRNVMAERVIGHRTALLRAFEASPDFGDLPDSDRDDRPLTPQWKMTANYRRVKKQRERAALKRLEELLKEQNAEKE